MSLSGQEDWLCVLQKSLGGARYGVTQQVQFSLSNTTLCRKAHRVHTGGKLRIALIFRRPNNVWLT